VVRSHPGEPKFALIAQLVEHRFCKPVVPCSNHGGGTKNAGVAQLVEHYLAKVNVASSNLVSRSIFRILTANNFRFPCERLQVRILFYDQA
jgi:hypothetical protein